MAINKKFICFKTLENYQREYDAGNILPKSICFCADAKAIYLNGKQFSINSLYNLEQLLESGTELASTDHLDEAVVKLYNNIKLIQEDIENVENEHTELAKIVKLLVSEIADLETGLKEEIATNAEITSAALNDLNTNLKALENQVEGYAKWDDLDNILKELLAYGVEWKENVADPHLTRIGNMSLHKTLPIQSQLKGCIAQANKVIYWLDENDWRFRKDAQTITVNLTTSTETFTVPSTEGLGINQYLRSGEYLAKITAIDTGASTITVAWELPESEETPNLTTITSLEVGSRLDGYDGTVRVYCPNFYIKSQIIGDTRRVWLSTVKIDNTWTYQHEILIDAYRSTVLNTVPENMGYLSTLPVNSAISVVNTAAYCRGGGNGVDNDKYLTGADGTTIDIFRTELGKPRTFLDRPTMRTYSRNAGSEMLSYDQYKNIFYWLYVVEYANFNCQEAYNEALTDEGYHQGGLGASITNMKGQYQYNVLYPLTPCGYGNKLGNRTGLVPLTIPEFINHDTNNVIAAQTMQMARWRGFDNPFGDIYTNLDGMIIDAHKYPNNMSYVYTCQDPTKFGDTLTEDYEKVGEETKTDGYTKLFDLGDAAHIIPKVMGGDTTTYKCDYHFVGYNKSLCVPLVGGYASSGMDAGLGNFGTNSGGVYHSNQSVGFRSVSRLVSFSQSE